MIIKSVAIGVVGLTGMAATTAFDPSPFISYEKIGIAAITIGILLYLLVMERNDRIAMTKKYQELQEGILRSHTIVLEKSAEAMREHAHAMTRLAVALDRREGS